MRSPRRRLLPSMPPAAARFGLLVLLAAAAAAVAAGCDSSTSPTPTASASVAASEPASAAPSEAPGSGSAAPSGEASASAAPSSAAPAVSPPTQSDTDWGRIWDGVPPSFPIPVGAQPSQTMSEPVSGEWTTSDSAAEVLQVLLDGFAISGLRVVEISPPIEDGSQTLTLEGDGDCAAQVVVAPLGSETRIAAWYGADCPFE